MRNVFVEKVAAAGLFLLLWLYYRWLERLDGRRQKQAEQWRRQEREGSIPLPPELQWRGTASEVVLLSVIAPRRRF